MSLAGIFLAAMLLAIAIVDFRTFRIPNRLSLPLVAAGLVWAAQAGSRPWIDYALGATLGYAGLAAFGAVYFRLRGREGLGLGDAKLFAAAGAWLGWQALPLVLAAASLAGLAYVAIRGRIRADVELAFGPWIALTILLCWLVLE